MSVSAATASGYRCTSRPYRPGFRRLGRNILSYIPTPEINGTVERVAADVTVDQRTGASHYLVRIGVARDEVARLGEVKLVPGMPVEAHLRTGDRRVISWLMKPLSDQMMRAFRER